MFNLRFFCLFMSFDFIKYVSSNPKSVMIFTTFILFVFYNIVFLFSLIRWLRSGRSYSKPSYLRPSSGFQSFRRYRFKKGSR